MIDIIYLIKDYLESKGWNPIDEIPWEDGYPNRGLYVYFANEFKNQKYPLNREEWYGSSWYAAQIKPLTSLPKTTVRLGVSYRVPVNSKIFNAFKGGFKACKYVNLVYPDSLSEIEEFVSKTYNNLPDDIKDYFK